MTESYRYDHALAGVSPEYHELSPDGNVAPAGMDAGRRSILTPLMYLPAVAVLAAAWLSKSSFATDLGIILMSAAAALLLLNELWRFPIRFGVGGIVAFGGVLIWFSYDYFDHWFGKSARDVEFPMETLAKAAFYHALLAASLAAGLLIRWGAWLERAIVAIPEPRSPRFYVFLIAIATGLGLSPYILFTSDPLYVTIFKEMFRGYGGNGANWTLSGVYGGNITGDWAFYVMFLTETGRLGGVLAGIYAILVGRTAVGKTFGWGVWLFWTLLAAGGGVRGDVLFMTLPPTALLFIKHQARATELMQKFSLRAFVISGSLLFATLFICQYVGMFRTGSLAEGDVGRVSMTDLQGNLMFSESLIGFGLIPDEHEFFYNRFPLEGAFRLLPNVLVEFVIHPIPRPLWPGKPVDEAFLWYTLVTRGDAYLAGNTLPGAAGYWYYRYGFWGVVEGGMLMGWLMAVSERALRRCDGRPLAMVLSLTMSVWLFRCFRGFNIPLLYHVIVAAAVLWLLVVVERRFTAEQN